MECKVIIGAGERSYQIEAKDEVARTFIGKKMGDTVSGAVLGLKGYDLKVTGGSDKDGFPMKREIEGRARAAVLFSKSGVGYASEGRGIRKRKSVRGNTIAEDIAQINLKVVNGDPKVVGKLLGKSDEKPAEKKEEAKKQEPKGEPKKEGKKAASEVNKPAASGATSQ